MDRAGTLKLAFELRTLGHLGSFAWALLLWATEKLKVERSSLQLHWTSKGKGNPQVNPYPKGLQDKLSWY